MPKVSSQAGYFLTTFVFPSFNCQLLRLTSHGSCSSNLKNIRCVTCRRAFSSTETSYVPTVTSIQGNKRKYLRENEGRRERKREDEKSHCAVKSYTTFATRNGIVTELHLSLFNYMKLLTGSRRYGHCSRDGATLLLLLFSLSLGALILGW